MRAVLASTARIARKPTSTACCGCARRLLEDEVKQLRRSVSGQEQTVAVQQKLLAAPLAGPGATAGE